MASPISMRQSKNKHNIKRAFRVFDALPQDIRNIINFELPYCISVRYLASRAPHLIVKDVLAWKAGTNPGRIVLEEGNNG